MISRMPHALVTTSEHGLRDVVVLILQRDERQHRGDAVLGLIDGLDSRVLSRHMAPLLRMREVFPSIVVDTISDGLRPRAVTD